jgi:hypothetical protein
LSKQKEIKLKAQAKKGTGVSKKSSVQPENVIKVTMENLEKSLLHRDFKIQGVVGEPGQKDKLRYQLLVSQIEAGVRKEYSELEIVNAVVRAVQPGLQLRSYFESVTDLTLPRLRKIIRFHYHEKSATELYQMLANITQQPKEDPQSFLVRILTIRQKIIFASKESGNNITYDESSVQGLFLHALETGLIDETIRAKMRPTLQNPLVTDEDFIYLFIYFIYLLVSPYYNTQNYNKNKNNIHDYRQGDRNSVTYCRPELGHTNIKKLSK